MNLPEVIIGGDKVVKIGGGFNDGERDGVAVSVEDGGFGWGWRAYEICRERKKVLESEGERVFEIGKDGLDEVVSRVREFVQVKALHRTAKKPRYVEEGERKRGWWD